jgi:hypothetical protein
MCRASARSLLARFCASTGGGLGRLGQVDDRANLRQLISHKPPASRRLQRDLKLLAAELLAESPDALPVRRRDPRSRDLTGLGIQPLRGDLRSVLIKTHHDRHRLLNRQARAVHAARG